MKNCCYVGEHTALIKGHLGHWFYVDTRDLGLFRELITHGFYEKQLLRFFLSQIDRNSTVIEAGANIGYYAVAACRVKKPKRYYAFECHPRTFGLLDRNAIFNRCSNLTVVQKAASDHNGEVTFSAPTHHPTGAGVLNEKMKEGIASTVNLDESNSEHRKILNVPAITIDQFVADNGIGKIDLIKADAEGSEYFILRGAEKTLRANPDIKLILEYNKAWLSNHIDPAKFISYIQGLGFKIKIISPRFGITFPCSPERLEAMDLAEILLYR